MVSAALVAEREADDEPATAASASNDKQGASPTSSGPDKDGSAQVQGEVQKKKMVQRPVYFVSSLLQGARSRYSGVQKLLFGLLMASRKLRHYFQDHEITVVTHLALQRILHNTDATGRIVEWALGLSSFG